METMMEKVVMIYEILQYMLYGLVIIGTLAIICGFIMIFDDMKTAINKMYGPRH